MHGNVSNFHLHLTPYCPFPLLNQTKEPEKHIFLLPVLAVASMHVHVSYPEWDEDEVCAFLFMCGLDLTG